MARITVEDCVDKVPDRFELVLLSAQRARQLLAGAAPGVPLDNDKNTLVALREIASETVNLGDLRESSIEALQCYADVDEPEEGEMEMQSLGNRFADLVAEEVAETESRSRELKLVEEEADAEDNKV